MRADRSRFALISAQLFSPLSAAMRSYGLDLLFVGWGVRCCMEPYGSRHRLSRQDVWNKDIWNNYQEQRVEGRQVWTGLPFQELQVHVIFKKRNIYEAT